jgi:Protein of unknown function (DUF1524)
MMNILIRVSFLFIFCSVLYPHPGRTDKNGGHQSSKTNKYHYHNKKTVITTKNTTKYNRQKHFGSWIDEDKDGQNTRAEVLIDESKIPVKFKTSQNRLVISGLWLCPFTGLTISNASMLDIDHIVPLKEAWLSGASNWTKTKRVQFANHLSDPNHLIAVYKKANRSKGARDPAHWLPTNTNFIVEYLQIWVKIKNDWSLDMDTVETAIITKYLDFNTKN